jgi:hypothetical protein
MLAITNSENFPDNHQDGGHKKDSFFMTETEYFPQKQQSQQAIMHMNNMVGKSHQPPMQQFAKMTQQPM